MFVDDIIITSDDLEEKSMLDIQLSQEFDFKKLGPLQFLYFSQNSSLVLSLSLSLSLVCVSLTLPNHTHLSIKLFSSYRVWNGQGKVVTTTESWRKFVTRRERERERVTNSKLTN